MIVKDLIIELMEYDMNAEVEIEVVTEENDETISDFEIEERGYSKRWVSIAVKSDGYVLVDKNEYKNLKEEKSELEDKVSELEVGIVEYERQIQDMESGE